jgi:Flp pilus assembly protein TadD
MRPLLLPMAAAVLAGCASAPVADVPRQLFADSRFANVARPPVEDDIFALSPAMRAFAQEHFAGSNHMQLAQALQREIKLEYDTGATRAAADTFTARAGNCLSLVILTGAFARHLEIPFDYQSVYGHDSWSRAQGMAFLSGHVNINVRSASGGLTVDFVEATGARPASTHVIGEDTVRAMYLNNRAAEALVAGDRAAYWWARAAIEAEPGYVAPVNTLAVIYLRSDAPRQAEAALRHVLEREPDNVIALTNMVRAYVRLGQHADAEAMRARLAAIEPYPPFYFLDQGLAAIERGEYDKARALLNKELRRMPFHDEVHFAMALADLREGEKDDASRHLSLAVKYSITRERRDIYSAKLSHLRGSLN